MTSRKFFRLLRLSAALLAVCGAFCPCLPAQTLLASAPVPDAPIPLVEAATSMASTAPNIAGEHRFWDKQNCALFAATAVSNGADFAVTHANLQSGGQELNPVVRMFGRSSPGLAVNFIGETVGVVSLSYFFYKTGHHKLERAVSIVHLGSSVGAGSE